MRTKAAWNRLTQDEVAARDLAAGFYSYDKYKRNTEKRRYVCPVCGKMFLTAPKSVWAGKIKSCGCISSYTVRHTQDEVAKKDAAVNMFSYDIYEGQNKKRRYVCPLCGKMFLTVPHSVWRGLVKSCGCMANRQKRLTQEEADAKDREAGWYSDDIYVTQRVKRRYICPACGEIAFIKPNTIWDKKTKGCSCRKSPGMKRRSQEDVEKQINEKTDFVLAGIYKDAKEYVEFKCRYGHIFLSTTNRMLNCKVKCPECSPRIFVNGTPVSYSQNELKKMADDILNVDGQHNVSLPFGDFRKIVPDITYEDFNLLVEYDGWRWHKDRLKDDQEKNEYLLNKGWNLLRVKSGHMLPDKKVLKQTIYHLITNPNINYKELVLSDWGEK